MSASILAMPGVDTTAKKPGRRAKRVYKPDTITQTVTIEETRPTSNDTPGSMPASSATVSDDLAMCAVFFRTLAVQFERLAVGLRR